MGLIKDEKGEPIIGATVRTKEGSTGGITDIDGLYSINIPVEEQSLIVSYIGYQTQEVLLNNRQNITVELKEEVKEIEEVVVTAFGVGQKKNTLTGSVTQIRPKELRVPSSNLSSSFAGRLAGVIAVQRSGEPGADGADFWIRGKSTYSGAVNPLIIIDGMQVASDDLNNLDPEVIESFSILKDATATAMYGTLGANGVMIVTTKKGENLKKPIINFRLESSMSQLSKVPSMVDGATYMELYNEAASRPDASRDMYSQATIDATRAGIYPLVYPDVDWYDELFKKNSFSEKFHINVRGGSSWINYFMSASVNHNSGNLRSLSKDYFSYNNNINKFNYNFVNNLDVKLTSTTKVSLGLNVGLVDYSGPIGSPSSYFSTVMDANPVDFPVVFPAQPNDAYIRWGGKTSASSAPFANPVAELVSGFKSYFTSKVIANIKLSQDLSMITKGLKFTGLFSFKNWSRGGTKRQASYNRFEIGSSDPNTGEYTLNQVGNEVGTALSTTSDSNNGDRTIYIQGILNYYRTFGQVHDIDLMFMYNQEEYSTNLPTDLYTSLPQRKQGIAGRVSYAYANKYMAEANFGYNGSENFAKNHRFGFFPSIGIGYNISEEFFWKNLKNVVDNLKLRASYGLVGNDNTGAGRFAYAEDLSLGTGMSYSTGVSGQYLNLTGPSWKRYYNPGLTWEVGKKWNVGVDMTWFNSLRMNIEWFRETRENIFQNRKGTIPQIIGTGSSTIYGNLGKVRNEGLEAAVEYNNQVNKNLFISFKGNFTYAHNKVLVYDEPDFQLYPNLSMVGGSMGRHLLYVAEGLFPDQESIDNSPVQSLGTAPLPGDIKYKDLPDVYGNKSNTITSDDRMYMGYPTTPEIVYGFGPSIKYKKWDVSCFFQGVARTSLLMSDFFPFGDREIRGVLDFIAENHWSESNPDPNALFPRLKLYNNQNNQVASSYWLRNGAFLKLRNAEIGYTHKKMRFYISGTNLLTFSPFKYWDPEMGGGNGLSYPTQRTFNIGFQMTIN